MEDITEKQKEVIEKQKIKFSNVLSNNFMQVVFKSSTAYLLSKLGNESKEKTS